MRSAIILFIIAGNILFISCAKTRNCSCDLSSTLTTVTTPRSSAQPSTNVSNSTGKTEYSVGKARKNEMEKINLCNSRIEGSSNTSTTMVSVYTETVVNGMVIGYYTSRTADVVSTTRSEYTCRIK